MAQKISVELTDDLTGAIADETVTFAIDGVAYEIDLTTENAARLREALDGYVAAGRKAGRGDGRSRAPRGTGTPRNSESGKIRAWAKNNGFQVSPRGRVNATVVDAYTKAQAA